MSFCLLILPTAYYFATIYSTIHHENFTVGSANSAVCTITCWLKYPQQNNEIRHISGYHIFTPEVI